MTGATAPLRHRGRDRIGRVAGGAAMIVVLIVGGATPAGADPSRSMSIAPTGDVSAPPTATGTFKASSVLEKIQSVSLTLTPKGPTGGSAITQDGCAVASAGECDTGEITFTWDLPALDYNGPYVVEATGTSCAVILCVGPTSGSVTPIEFRLGAEPKAPTDLKVGPGDDRSVEVSWARNAEPDMLYYALFRQDPGGQPRRVGNDIKQPASGRLAFTDTSVAGTNGGDFVYTVVAVRKGFSGDEKSTKLSRASASRSVTVAAPPTTTTPPGDPGAPPSTLPGQGTDLSTFLSGQAPTLPTPPPIFLDLPDTGFGETLPFGNLPGGADESEPGAEDAIPPQSPRQRVIAQFNRNRPLIPVAAGAILLVLAGHIRLLNVRTRAVPEKPPPGTYVARALEAARANAVPIPVAAPAAVVAGAAHHRAPPDDDLAGLPVWAEFEPVSALGLLDASGPNDDDDLADDGGFALYAPQHPLDTDVEGDMAPEVEPVPTSRRAPPSAGASVERNAIAEAMIAARTLEAEAEARAKADEEAEAAAAEAEARAQAADEAAFAEAAARADAEAAAMARAHAAAARAEAQAVEDAEVEAEALAPALADSAADAEADAWALVDADFAADAPFHAEAEMQSAVGRIGVEEGSTAKNRAKRKGGRPKLQAGAEAFRAEVAARAEPIAARRPAPGVRARKARDEAAARAVAQPEAESEASRWAGSGARAEKARVELAARADSRARARARAEAEARADAEARAEAEVRAAEEAEAEAEAARWAASGARAKKVRAEAVARADAEARAQAEADARADAEARVQAEADARADAEARVQAEADARADAEARAQAAAEAGPARAEADARAAARAKSADARAKSADASVSADARGAAAADAYAEAGEVEPEIDAALLYDFDGESQWETDDIEVFVSPRR